MQRIIGILIVTLAFFLAGCPKEVIDGNSTLYGVWIRSSTSPGPTPPPSPDFPDTLLFSNKNGKNILEFNYPSPSPIPRHISTEYVFRDGVFYFRDYSVTGGEMLHVKSFTWKNKPEEFEIVNHELFVFMSSLQYWSYRKIP